MQKRKKTCLLQPSKCKFSLLAPSLHQQLALVLFSIKLKKHGLETIGASICFGLFSKRKYLLTMVKPGWQLTQSLTPDEACDVALQ